MTSLAEQIRDRITREGPMTVADYMTTCLLHPTQGYYTTRDPIGSAGDFITAPEVSQMFGEVIGLALAQAWIDRGRPSPFNLVELGPGRGTLMADVIRAAGAVPGFSSAAQIHLVEVSPLLRQQQSAAIPAKVEHHDTFDTVPDGPIFLIANEFFDALPVRQFLRDGAGWRERVIGLNDGALAFGLTDPTRPNYLTHRLEDTVDGDLVEVSPAGEALANILGVRIAAEGGLALVIDYGDWRVPGDTFQAVGGHEKVDPLAAPGTADLTCHVDFDALARAAAPAFCTPLATQGVFLERLGITTRANQLAAKADEQTADAVVTAHRRLTHPDEMGNLFKAIALYRHSDPVPPGFGT